MNPKPEVSNAVQLTGRQWIGVGLYAAALFFFGPMFWRAVETFEPDAEYRIPHALSNDYWQYDRWARLAASRFDVLVVGDSAIWGPYVKRDQTLSAHLNRRAGSGRFANLGVEGADPTALAGLLETYGGGVSKKKFLIQYNPTWVRTPETDYQAEQDLQISHPRLLPQFTPRIPGYAIRLPWEKAREEIEKRLGNVVQRETPLGDWTGHLQAQYYEEKSVAAWTLEHPYEIPLRAKPEFGDTLRHASRPWFQQGIRKQDYPWVQPAESIHWRSFLRALEILQRRGNQVFVLVGPFNEHMLEAPSLAAYRKLQAAVETDLRQKNLPYLIPAALPSEHYGDASHPLGAGYELLAKALLEQPFFK